MRKLFTWILLGIGISPLSAQHLFEIDLNKLEKDILPVKLTLEKAPSQEQVRFSFPATVPGTYDIQDFGRFILSLNAFGSDGKKLKVKKEGNNTFIISNAKQLHHLEYTVEDILDRKVKKHPVFGPVATNFIAGKNFIFNNGGIFGFFEGEESNPIRIHIRKPENLYGATSLPQSAITSTEQQFLADSYHQLIDCPIMFSVPDTAQFFVGKTKVTISVYDVTGKPRAKHFYDILKRDMQAIDDFLPDLPVENYTFLVYIDDLHEVGDALNGKMGFFKKVKLALKFRSLGIGALEHGNSSTYYLADFGPNFSIKEISVDEQLSGAAIHEFMHILTPLGLHSQHIGNFNYTKPVMSKHLWLYEGITEYFANLIKYKGGVYTPDEYLRTMEVKLAEGQKFPAQEMAFTEMSAHVLEEKYHKHYGQVYQRGAVLGMLLDAEIQRLTQGKKALIDVVLTLNARYGAKKSFDEDSFIQEFVKEVHPDLQRFFDLYIEGKNQWKPNDQLNYIGIVYHDTLKENALLNPLSKTDNDIEVRAIGVGLEQMVMKTGPSEWAGFKPGDVINVNDYREAFRPNNQDLKEGETAKLKVKRDKKTITLEIKVRYGLKTKTNALRWK